MPRGGAGDHSPLPGGRQTSLLDLPEHLEQPYYLDYTSNPLSFDSEIMNSVTACTPKFLVVECHCGRRVVRHTCMKLNCKNCAKILTERRARAVMDRLMQLSHEYEGRQYYPTILYTVFTMPMELRIKCKDKKFMSGLRAKIYKMLHVAFGAEFAFEATHPISEDYPDEFHPHLNFLWKQKQGSSPYIDLSVLRAYYADILGYQGEPNVYSQYSNKPGQLWKWCKYVARTFPAFSKWCGHTKWFGKHPKLSKKEPRICQECHQAVKVLGYIAACDINDYELFGFRSGRAPPWENDDKITPFHQHKSTAKSTSVSYEYYSE
jgi:hypothetical protein